MYPTAENLASYNIATQKEFKWKVFFFPPNRVFAIEVKKKKLYLR